MKKFLGVAVSFALAAVVLFSGAQSASADSSVKARQKKIQALIASVKAGGGMTDPCLFAGLKAMETGSLASAEKIGRGKCGTCIIAGMQASGMTATLLNPRATNPAGHIAAGVASLQSLRTLPSWIVAGMRTRDGRSVAQAIAAQDAADTQDPVSTMLGCASTSKASSALPGGFANSPVG